MSRGTHVHHTTFGDGTIVMLMGHFALVEFPAIYFESTRTVSLDTLQEC
jgi:hypothetical protein